MTQGPYWDWLYKNGRQPSPTPAWPLDQQLYPPGQAQPWYTPQALAGDPSGGMSWRNSLRGTPPQPWNYYRLPLQMQGGETPYQSRPVFRNDYAPQDTTRAQINYPPDFARSQPTLEDYLAARNNALAPGQTPYAGGSGMQGSVYGNLRGRGPSPAPEPTPQPGAGKKLNSPARQSGGPTVPSTIPAIGPAVAPTFDTSPPPAAGPQPWERWQAAPVGPAANPGTNPAGWDVPGEWGSLAQGQGAALPAEWAWNQYDPNNPGAVPPDLWSDPGFLNYAGYVNDLAYSARGGGGGSNNYAFQNSFDQAQADARNAQWAQEFQRTGDQWGQNFAQTQARDARQAEQWAKEMERNQAVDRWTQAFQQAQQDWNKTDAEAKNRLQDQGQNLGAFGRRFGPNVAYM